MATAFTTAHQTKAQAGASDRPGNSQNAHTDSDIWQDGALFADTAAGLTAYFAAFTNQTIPTSELGILFPGGARFNAIRPEKAGSGNPLPCSQYGGCWRMSRRRGNALAPPRGLESGGSLR